MIDRISTTLVPVAVNLYKVRRAKDAGGELFRSVQDQKDQYQGIWIVSPEGKVLSGHHDVKSQKTWSPEILQTIDRAMKQFGEVSVRNAERREPLPHRGCGILENGSVRLAVYCRAMMGGGRKYAPSVVEEKDSWKWNGKYRPDGPAVIDSLALTAEEWGSFAPARAEKGISWSVSDAVARKLCRVLSASSDQSTMPSPEEAKVAELKAVVESVENGRATIRLTGRWHTEHYYEISGERKPSYGWSNGVGTAVYDVESRSMKSLLLVFSGAYKSRPPWDKGHRQTGAVVEWKAR